MYNITSLLFLYFIIEYLPTKFRVFYLSLFAKKSCVYLPLSVIPHSQESDLSSNNNNYYYYSTKKINRLKTADSIIMKNELRLNNKTSTTTDKWVIKSFECKRPHNYTVSYGNSTNTTNRKLVSD